MADRPAAIPTILVDDERVRVTRWDFAPGAETGWHTHELDYVVTPITDMRMMLQEPGGVERILETPLGQSYRRSCGVEHNVINAGEAPMAFVEVELK